MEFRTLCTKQPIASHTRTSSSALCKAFLINLSACLTPQPLIAELF
jgi:hypothetical protein